MGEGLDHSGTALFATTRSCFSLSIWRGNKMSEKRQLGMSKLQHSQMVADLRAAAAMPEDKEEVAIKPSSPPSSPPFLLTTQTTKAI